MGINPFPWPDKYSPSDGENATIIEQEYLSYDNDSLATPTERNERTPEHLRSRGYRLGESPEERHHEQDMSQASMKVTIVIVATIMVLIAMFILMGPSY